MNRKKWQGVSCFLLASLMVSSSFAAPVRNEAPKATTAPKSVTAPQTPGATSKSTQGSQASGTTTTPSTTGVKTTTTPTTTTAPKSAVTAPAKTTAPSSETKKVPSSTSTETTPNKGAQEKTNTHTTTPEKAKEGTQTSDKTCPAKPFALDHFKMIVNTLKKMGVEESEIVAYIKDGKKLEEILEIEKLNPKKFKKCIIKEYYAEVDTAQKNGQITAEQSKQLKAAIKETIKNWLPKK